MSLCRGASAQPTSPSMSSWLSVLESQEELLAKHPPAYYQHQPRRRPNWLPQPSRWWPCRTIRWICNFIAAFLRLLVSKHWVDQVYTLALLVGFLCGCWAAIEGVLHIAKGAAAQDADCSVVYVTIPGPIVTVSLVGQTPKDPNHGTYYYSVINGTTRWLDSIAPPTRSSNPTSSAPGANPISPGITTIPPSSQAPAPGLPPPPGSPSATPLPSAVPLLPTPPGALSATTPRTPTSFLIIPPPSATPSTSTVPIGSPSRSSPLVTSTTVPPGAIISSLPPASSQGAQLPPSGPPPVVITNTLKGSAGTSTVVVTLSNGPNT
ncbi:hypothetical protein P171DRAFT_520431 [Karstenula rhodostoma CBS 690.94]|uniref:Uncharacterized protein n=1 Tax=Karstenula rhodostoma CBS 690.94 TaxID=1392251 RepID=A0A9P4PKF5_9PLEO|nr:hypothetical protein P171DRAFT_520431 [Karstenula rhodostoma CBS 690.94]